MIPAHAVEAQRLAEQMRGQGDMPEPLFELEPSQRPACDPATLGAPCTGCDRGLHRAGKVRMCRVGHPRHHGNGLCTSCDSRARRARHAARAAQTVPGEVPRPAPQAHTYCVHDEGERCDCDVELRRHMPEKERKQGRRADR